MPEQQTLERIRQGGDKGREGETPSRQARSFLARLHGCAPVLLFAVLGLAGPVQSQTVEDRGADLAKLPPTRLAEASASSTLTAGTPVRTPAGETIGSVKDVVPDPATGQPAFVLVAIRTGANCAIPYPAVTFKESQIVLDRSRLEGAPHVEDSQLHDKADSRWQTAAKRYWLGNTQP